MARRGVFSAAGALAILNRDFASKGLEEFDPMTYLSSCRARSQSLDNHVAGLELRTYMHNQLLRDADVMSMAHSLEVRAPLLDHRLVEFLARVPASVKFDGRPKDLLIRALADELPAEIVARPKRGFHFPFEVWLKADFRKSAEEILSASVLADILDRKGVKTLWQQFLAKRVRWSHVWSVMILQTWIQQFAA
jgi:asparagine synthase (glutamine-hydrolysing)